MHFSPKNWELYYYTTTSKEESLLLRKKHGRHRFSSLLLLLQDRGRWGQKQPRRRNCEYSRKDHDDKFNSSSSLSQTPKSVKWDASRGHQPPDGRSLATARIRKCLWFFRCYPYIPHMWLQGRHIWVGFLPHQSRLRTFKKLTQNSSKKILVHVKIFWTVFIIFLTVFLIFRQILTVFNTALIKNGSL